MTDDFPRSRPNSTALNPDRAFGSGLLAAMRPHCLASATHDGAPASWDSEIGRSS
jgi:hypothetical protein